MGTIVADVIDIGEKRDGSGRRITAARRREELVRAYLRDVLTRLPAMTSQDDLAALTPARWQPAG